MKLMRKVLTPAILVGSAAMALADGESVDASIQSALTSGASSATTYLGLAIAITVAFFVFKLGKRALNKA